MAGVRSGRTDAGPIRPAAAEGLVALAEIHRGGAAILLLLDLEADLLTLVQASQPRLLHGADVDEDILPARIRGDEAVAFGRIEPLNGALGHRHVAFLPADGAPVTGRPPSNCRGAQRTRP